MSKVLEVPQNKFAEIPELYQKGDLHPAIEKTIHISDGKVIFYINLDKLVTNLNSPS